MIFQNLGFSTHALTANPRCMSFISYLVIERSAISKRYTSLLEIVYFGAMLGTYCIRAHYDHELGARVSRLKNGADCLLQSSPFL